MASQIRTLGTAATTTLSAWLAGGLSTSPQQDAADIATIALAIKNDLVNGHPIWPEAYSMKNLLYIPNRGVLQVRPGDFVAVDGQGWPILVSANSAASASWVHT